MRTAGNKMATTMAKRLKQRDVIEFSTVEGYAVNRRSVIRNGIMNQKTSASL